MRAVDLAVYADSLAAEAGALAARLDRSRRRLREAAIEQEARRALPATTRHRLEALGLLRPPTAADELEDVAEAQADLAAIERLQAWVEEQLYAARASDEPSPVSSAVR